MACYRLICIQGDVVPAQIDVDEAIECGRDPHCDVRLLGESSSRYHFQVTPHKEGVIVTDHQSRNGTWLGGKRCEQMLLRPGCSYTPPKQLLSLCKATFRKSRSSPMVALPLARWKAGAPRPWQGGDDLGELTGLHALTRRLAQTPDLKAAGKIIMQSLL